VYAFLTALARVRPARNTRHARGRTAYAHTPAGALAESRIITPTRFSPLERLPEPALRRIVGVQSRRPFSPWESIQKRVPEHLEVRRFERIPDKRRAKSWNRLRAHAPHDRLVPPEWDMDVLYFRFQEE
jgi:hypothetical protein